MALFKVKTGHLTWKYVTSSMKLRMGEYMWCRIKWFSIMLLINCSGAWFMLIGLTVQSCCVEDSHYFALALQLSGWLLPSQSLCYGLLVDFCQVLISLLPALTLCKNEVVVWSPCLVWLVDDNWVRWLTSHTHNIRHISKWRNCTFHFLLCVELVRCVQFTKSHCTFIILLYMHNLK